MATLDDRPTSAVVATSSPFDPCCRLSRDNPALGGGEQLLAFGEGETDIFRDRGCLSQAAISSTPPGLPSSVVI
jgi:hypothetical protein